MGKNKHTVLPNGDKERPLLALQPDLESGAASDVTEDRAWYNNLFAMTFFTTVTGALRQLFSFRPDRVDIAGAIFAAIVAAVENSSISAAGRDSDDLTRYAWWSLKLLNLIMMFNVRETALISRDDKELQRTIENDLVRDLVLITACCIQLNGGLPDELDREGALLEQSNEYDKIYLNVKNIIVKEGEFHQRNWVQIKRMMYVFAAYVTFLGTSIAFLTPEQNDDNDKIHKQQQHIILIAINAFLSILAAWQFSNSKTRTKQIKILNGCANRDHGLLLYYWSRSTPEGKEVINKATLELSADDITLIKARLEKINPSPHQTIDDTESVDIPDKHGNIIAAAIIKVRNILAHQDRDSTLSNSDVYEKLYEQLMQMLPVSLDHRPQSLRRLSSSTKF